MSAKIYLSCRCLLRWMMSTYEHRVAVPDGLTVPGAKRVAVAGHVQERTTVTDRQQLLGRSKRTLLPIRNSLGQREFSHRTEEEMPASTAVVVDTPSLGGAGV